MDFRDFENKYQGQTIWVLGAGKTLEFIDSSFFDDKVVVATNATFRNRVKTGFVCSNHWVDYSETDLPVIMPENHQVPDGATTTKHSWPTAVYVPTIDQKYSAFFPANDWPEHGRFVVGPTSLHLSLHWALWIGAAHIVLVGADCGTIDGENNVDGYIDQAAYERQKSHNHHKLWQKTLVEMAQQIRSFGVSVHSLNPWVTFGLEGHTWTQER